MARFHQELPNDLIKVFEDLETNCEDIFGEMCRAGVEVVYNNVKSNMSKVSGSAKDVTKEMQSMQSRGSGFMRNLASSANTYSRSIVSGLSNVIAKARDAFNSLSSLSRRRPIRADAPTGSCPA